MLTMGIVEDYWIAIQGGGFGLVCLMGNNAKEGQQPCRRGRVLLGLERLQDGKGGLRSETVDAAPGGGGARWPSVTTTR